MAVLALLHPLDTDTGERVPMRVCSANTPEACGADGQEWWPAISRAPKLSIDLFDGDFTGAVSVGAGQMTVRLEVIEEGYGKLALNWADAPVEMWSLRAAAGIRSPGRAWSASPPKTSRSR